MIEAKDKESGRNRVAGPEADCDINAVLQAQTLASHYQPIISIREKKVIGVDALARATDPTNGRPIGAQQLFEAAHRRLQVPVLDRACREAAVAGFAELARLDADLMLFVNVDASALGRAAAESSALIKLTESYGMAPERVAIEIAESRIKDMASLQRFITQHRKRGFVIVLDDMGAGQSNLERVPSIRPDIIKLDRSLIHHIDREYHKQELFDFFVKLAQRIGVILIAEGIETEAEALCCLERGADLVQGYYFARPQPPDRACLETGLHHASRLRTVLTSHMVDKFTQRKQMYRHYKDVAGRITAVVQMSDPSAYEEILERALSRFPLAECAYIINASGRQITRTVFNPSCPPRKQAPLFGPAPAGGNQSAKDCFMYLGKNQHHFVTRPRVSYASGNMCVTISNRVSPSSGESYVVCVDIKVSEDLVS